MCERDLNRTCKAKSRLTQRPETSTSSIGIGGHIAIGIGFSRSTASIPTPSTTLLSVASQKVYSNRSHALTTSAQTPSTSLPTNFPSYSYAPTTLSNIVGSNLTLNASTDLGDCWQQWTSFWSQNDSTNAVQAIPSTGGTTIITSSWTSYSTIPTDGPQKTIETLGWESFIYSTAPAVLPTAINAGSTVTFDMVTTITEVPGTSYITPDVTLPTPTCALPSSVEQCQSQWNDYESSILYAGNATDITIKKRQTSSGPSISSQYSQSNSITTASPMITGSMQRPSCSQASIQPSLCSQLQSNFEDKWGARENPAAAGNSTITSAAISGTIDWPASSVLGPGCSLGCGGCAITGGTVQLLYWPVTETAGPPNATVTAHAFGTTLTSPTVYVSFASIYASDSCSGVGTTHGATIVPLDPSDLSSVWERYPDVMTARTASFNFTDLVGTTLAPDVASKRPQCAVWLSSQYDMASMYAPNTTCPGAYCGEPISKIALECLCFPSPC